MKIGYDFVQPSASLAGCGWYTYSLLNEMAKLASEHAFLGYRHFGEWFIDPTKLLPLPASPNISDPLANLSLDETIQIWQNDLAQGEVPGRPDLVHSTSFQSPRLIRTKLVVTIYDLSFWTNPEYTTDNIRQGCQAGVLDSLAHADGLIFISAHARDEFDQFLPTFARRGAIPTLVTPLAARWPAMSSAPPLIGNYWLFVGSLEPRKNLINLLIAYQNYIRNHPSPLPLWLVGGEGWKNEDIMRHLQPLEARNHVRRLGFVPDHELRTLYQGARALIFPSWYEGFGLPILEAMSQGCPVICSNRACLPETGGDAALYVNPAQPNEISNAMYQVEENEAFRKQMVLRGLAHAKTFAWTETAKQTLAFYQEVLSIRRPSLFASTRTTR